MLKTMPSEGSQNVPPQNMALWHRDYFEPKALEKKQENKTLPFETA